jgi:hypothetical protein
VHDIVDVYADEQGRLLGLSRFFYDEQPFRYTETYTFGEYRETNADQTRSHT